jgi:electron transport complex protein RnfC
VCPAQLLPQTLYRCIEAGDYDQAQTHRLSACIECGCCAAVCPSHIALVDYYRRAKTEIRSRDSRHRQAEHARQRFEARRQRLQREADERAVRLTQKKEQMRQVSRTAGQNPSPDAKKTAIEAALARTRAKKTATSSRPPEDH